MNYQIVEWKNELGWVFWVKASDGEGRMSRAAIGKFWFREAVKKSSVEITVVVTFFISAIKNITLGGTKTLSEESSKWKPFVRYFGIVI